MISSQLRLYRIMLMSLIIALLFLMSPNSLGLGQDSFVNAQLSDNTNLNQELPDSLFQSSNSPPTVISSTQQPSISSNKMSIDWISIGYALTVATGGIIGYVKAGSVPSLTAGLTFGGILGIGAYMTSVNPSNVHLTLGTSVVLSALMGYRFINSGKFMPAGLVTLLSLAMVINMSYKLYSTKQITKD